MPRIKASKSEIVVNNETVVKAQTFTKEQLIKSKCFQGLPDLLTALLKDGKEYTKDEASQLINEFVKRKVD